MSTLSSQQTTIDLFDNLTIQIDRYLAVFIFLFAVVGNVLNILVFSQRSLRSKPCPWLFLTSSIANLISIVFALTTRIMSGWWSFDPTETNASLCKLRAFILFTSRTIAFWLIALATVDRCLASSPNALHRQLNTLKHIQTIFCVVVLVTVLLYSQMFYCYDSKIVLTPLKCYGKTVICRLFSDIAYGAISISLPLILMIVFGLKTIYNIRQIQRRVRPQRLAPIVPEIQHRTTIPSERTNQWRNQDRHLFIMLTVQVIIQSFLTLPQVFAKFYISATMFQTQTPVKLAIDHFIYNLALLLSFLANGMPFYVYTLFGGSIFRRPLLNILNLVTGKILCHK